MRTKRFCWAVGDFDSRQAATQLDFADMMFVEPTRFDEQAHEVAFANGWRETVDTLIQ
ncbi:MAG: hypothetical protein GY796_19555 [Chloroflexi bacterium]|nr:hypothetical protein [Chloroflexota bacterium]